MPSQTYKLHTTRSWDFLGLNLATPQTLLSATNYGDDVIIGMVDTGIWPESESFGDRGLGPIPSRWRGTCQRGESFNASNCNRKIIGARFFVSAIIEELQSRFNNTPDLDYLSPRDGDGHGTHTASIAAGSIVHNASCGGLARGLARGGAPRARLAIYKACWDDMGCANADILAAIDAAIHDGVDILSISLGSTFPAEPGYLDKENGISMGAFHAMTRGITVVCSAGNWGPTAQQVVNTAPWILTVAASTIDRSFPAVITLGSGRRLVGQSMYSGKRKHVQRRIVYAGDIAAATGNAEAASSCLPGSLNATAVAGKIVLCFHNVSGGSVEFCDAASTVSEAGGAGMIFAMHSANVLSTCLDILGVQVDYAMGTEIYNYIMSTRNPFAKLTKPETVVGRVTSPMVAAFSSRGPGRLSSDIIKPDIAAPGVQIMAAKASSTISYRFDSGTSMACPHISGVAAMLKSLHPTWSPAAIKSAIVTTATTVDAYGAPIKAEGNTRKLADPFDFGGGHVCPNKAADPGLIYDMRPADYMHFLCSVGFSNTTIKRTMGIASSCQQPKRSVSDLNLPSISISNLKETTTVTRTVTNVGPVNSAYRAMVEAPHEVKITVKPSVLYFNETSTSATFGVTFSPLREMQGVFSFGSLIWTDGKHVVRIPIAVRVVIREPYADVF
ncbi:unnamed protein product [Victoria cruziana]